MVAMTRRDAFIAASGPIWLAAQAIARSQDQQSGRQGPGLPPPAAQPAPLDLTNNVLLTVKAEQNRYEQLEPIFLHLEVTNHGDTSVWLDQAVVCGPFKYEILDLTAHQLVDAPTNFAKHKNPKPGREVELRHGQPMRFTVCPNLYVDLTVPTNYSVATLIRLKDGVHGRPCVARGNIVLVEVVHQFQSRIQRR